MDVQTFIFTDDGDVPNSRYPLILYPACLARDADAAAEFEDLFRANGWGASWRNGIFSFHHYHSTAHEVLGIAIGEADVRFGGESGLTLRVAAGDAVLIPAGVGHRRLWSSTDLLVVGAYPHGQTADLRRAGDDEGQEVRARIAAVRLPHSDPVGGPEGPLAAHWRDAA